MCLLFVVCSNCKFKRVKSVGNWNELRKGRVLMEELGFGSIYGG